jgi:hypothetical protein
VPFRRIQLTNGDHHDTYDTSGPQVGWFLSRANDLSLIFANNSVVHGVVVCGVIVLCLESGCSDLQLLACGEDTCVRIPM